MYRTWTEIDLSVIKENYFIYKSNLPQKSEIIAVVKADAYGHGATVVAKVLQQCGCKNFAVATLEEAIELRHDGITGSILILGFTPIANMKEVFENNLIQTIVSEEHAEKLRKIATQAKLIMAIDTGMNRIGIDADDPNKCVNIIKKYKGTLNILGIFTHLCVADSKREEDIEFTKSQIMKFDKLQAKIKDMGFLYCHKLNSAGGLKYCNSEGAIVRLGIILYGLKPDYDNILPNGIRPALQWKTIVSMVKYIKEGASVGYGRTFTAKSVMKIATISTGYADGFSRRMSNRGYVLINGKEAPVIGRVCMDQFMVDVSAIDDVEMGTEVILIGKSGDKEITADDMGKMINTIGYEVVCNISPRVQRVFC